MTEIVCPVCLSGEKKLLFKVPGATVSNCSKCSHAFSHDVEVPPIDVYNEDYFVEHHKNWFKHPNYPLFKRLASTCEKIFARKDISILDVGCGNGDFLKYCYCNGFTNLTGIDFSKNDHESIKFVQDNLFEMSPETFQQKFDAIVSLATIEHVENIHWFMAILSSLIKPGGIISIMTLDEHSLLYKLAKFGKKLGIGHGVNRLYDKHHLNHFSMKSLKNLVSRCGKYEVIEHYGFNFPVAAIDLPKSSMNIVINPMIRLIFSLTSRLRRGEFLQVITLKDLSAKQPYTIDVIAKP